MDSVNEQVGVGPVTTRIRGRSLGPQSTVTSAGYQFGRMGPVASLVAGFNSGRPLPAIPNLSAFDSTARRHGRAERGSGRRERSPRPHSWRSGRTVLENQSEFSTGQTAYARHQARSERALERALAVEDLGPENKSDFDTIIGDIYDRLDTVERYSRLHAGHIASSDAKISAMADDLEKYKEHITSTHKVIDTWIKERFAKTDDAHQLLITQLESLASVVTPRVEAMDARISMLESLAQSRPVSSSPVPPAPTDQSGCAEVPAGYGGLQAPAPAAGQCPSILRQTSQSMGNADQYTIHTQPQEVPRYITEDPWAPAAHAKFGDRFQNMPEAQGRPQTCPEQSGGLPQGAEYGHVPRGADQRCPGTAMPPTNLFGGGQGAQAGPCPTTVPMWTEHRGPPTSNFPGMPASFAQNMGQDERPSSPFAQGRDPFKTPERQMPYAGQHHNPGRSAWEGGRPSMFEPSWKENKLLFTFTGEAKDYKLWRSRVTDHMCRSTQLWRHLLDFVAGGEAPIRKDWLMGTNCHGINAWELSTMFESFIVNWLPRNMYNRRTQWAGGDFGNGFELWRRMYIEYQGGTEAVEFGGIRRLQEFPRCTSVLKLSEHLDDWLDVLTTYGHELEHCPRMLRNMVMSVIPSDMEDEIVEKSFDVLTQRYRPEFRTYEGIIRWCKLKVSQKRTKELSEFARKPPSGHLKSLNDRRTEDMAGGEGARSAEPVPLWAKDLIAAIQMSRTGTTSAPSPTAGSVEPPPEPLLHALRPNLRPKAKTKAGVRSFSFKGCWHCGKDEPGHSRKNCPGFLKLLKDSNPGITERKLMKLPAGYSGAYEKARVAAGLPAKSKRLNMLDDEDVDDDDAESDFGDDSLCTLRSSSFNVSDFPVVGTQPVKQRPQPFTSPNSFQALAEADKRDNISSEDIDSLNGWAHNVKQLSAKKSSKRHPSFKICSEEDLDNFLGRHPKIAAIPDKVERLKKILKTMPDALKCNANEVLCLVDSGATINAAWIARHFPQYLHLVMQAEASKNGDSAVTACGKKLLNKGRCVVHASAQGTDINMAFKDMETEVPILSVRKMVKKGNDVKFQKGGGTITNRTTGRVLRFYEYDGVYFLKIEVTDPSLFTDSLNSQSSPRQGG